MPEHFTSTLETAEVNETNRCRASLRVQKQFMELVCEVEACPVREVQIIGKHVSTEVRFEDIRRAAVLEIPDVCPRMADFDRNSPVERLPMTLRPR